MALLAKQTWRILKNPESLAGKVLKGLLWGKGLLDVGVRWRVGNGNSIRIYKDKWIPRPSTFKVVSPPTMNEQDTVSCPIAPSGSWNVPLLKNIFSIEDVNLILQIPICLSQREDDIIWHYEENGQFSVRSGYWIGRGLVNNEGSSNPGLMVSWWQSFWKTRIPIKIKIFVWKACHDWIPTMVNIACRGVQTDGLCGACKNSNETTLHSLWECNKLKHIRGEWWHGRNPLRSNHSNFFDLVCDISCLVSSEEMEFFYVLVWRIWFCRNSKIHGCQIYKVEDVVHWSEGFIAYFRSKEKRIRRGDVRSNVVITCWKPPEFGDYKANCDAVVERRGNCVGIGTVIRDSTGAVLAYCSQIMEANFSIKVAKLVAIRKCLIFCVDCGLTPCVIESDEATVVKWINDEDIRNSDCGIILSDISTMISNLHGVTVRHVRKRFNKAAHAQAKNALGISEDAFWMEEYPDCISKEVEADMPG
ncbi:hypothetical protein Dsin_024302 [Dipteronia sinensis]|uniref:Reverse transcriptase zinc-binding domain-containing protein n=1 Tax=Dipteronia sinensis TaxID=43782 RepID=A0AAE0DVX3_9ROSI|nr:hypothetical protein Dsin_024302 [Dipteronia sinensis]